jgi:translation initiation factor 1
MKPRSPDPNARAVYSTDIGSISPESRPTAQDPMAAGAARGKVVIRLERKGRAGKAVTVVSGLTGSEELLKDLSRQLKAACGAGGTRRYSNRGSEIEVQGDQREKTEDFLRRMGFEVKRSGG